MRVLAPLVCALLVPAAEAASPTWQLPAEDLSQPGNIANYPRVAAGPNGTATAVWDWIPPGGGLTYVQAATRRAGEASFDPAPNLSSPDADGFFPEVAIGPDGETTVLWLGLGVSVAYDVTVANRPAGQATFGGPGPMSSLPSAPVPPQLAMTADGSLTAIWVVLGPSQVPLIRTATKPAGKASFDQPIDIPNFGQSLSALPDPQVSVGRDGSTTAAWVGETSGSNVVRVATRPAGSNSFGIAQDLFQPAPLIEGVQVATAPDGTVTVVWASTDGYEWSTQTATRPAGQATFGPTETLSTGAQQATDPQLGFGPDGSAVAVWFQWDGSEAVIQAANRPAGQASFDEPQLLSEPGPDTANPELAVAPDGAVTAVWNQDNGTNTIIQTAYRAPGQSLFGTPQNISEPGEDATNPAVAVAPDGAATAVWPRASGSEFLIQGAKSDPTTYPLAIEVDGPGKVTSTPAGIACGARCSSPFPLSSSVTLTATPRSGATFSGWADACSGEEGTCTVDVLGPSTATATFTRTTVRVTSAKAKVTGNGVRITSRVKVSGEGKLKQRIASGPRTWCRSSKSVDGAGTVKLGCNLGRKGRKELRRGRLKFGLPTTFTPKGGDAVTTSRKLTLKRRP